MAERLAPTAEAQEVLEQIKISPVSVGRGKEIAWLQELGQEPEVGVALKVLEITGWQGIGKSTLLGMMRKEHPEIIPIDNADQINPVSLNGLLEVAVQRQLPVVIIGQRQIIKKDPFAFSVCRRTTSRKLTPLNEAQTIAQVGPIGERLYQLTNGYPAGSRFLAESLLANPQLSDRELADQLIKQQVHPLLEPLLSETRIAALPLLAVSQALDINVVRKLLQQLGPESYRELPDTLFLEELFKFGQAGAVEWDRDRQTFVVEPCLRPMLEAHLRLTQPEAWRQAHRICLAHFQETFPFIQVQAQRQPDLAYLIGLYQEQIAHHLEFVLTS